MNIQELADTWNAGIHALAEAALDNLQGKESAVTPESCVAPVSTRDILYKILDHLITVNLPKRFSLEQRVAAEAWKKICIQCDLSYPSSTKLTKVDKHPDGMEYAARHAIASYPPVFLLLASIFGPSHRQFWTFAWSAIRSCGSMSSAARWAFDIREGIITNVTPTKTLLQLLHGALSFAPTGIYNAFGIVYEPIYYLMVDKHEKKIVLSVRGTTSVADIVTDLDGTAEPVSRNIDEGTIIEGRVHAGMKIAAQDLKKQVHDQLIAKCQQFKDYQVIITGHSLGAGVAALLAFLYLDDEIVNKKTLKFPNGRLRCFAFACPPVVSKEFIEKKVGSSFITSVVVSTDMVPRLSVEAVKRMYERYDVICEALREDPDIIDKCIENFDTMNPRFKERKWYQLLQKLIKKKGPKSQERLFPMGEMLWFIPKQVMDPDNDDKQRRKNVQKMRIAGGRGWRGMLEMIPLIFAWLIYFIWALVLLFISCVIWCTDFNAIRNNMRIFAFLVRQKGSRRMAMDKYDGSNYVLCDASKCIDLFQDFVFDLPESLDAHFPIRYLMACGAQLARKADQCTPGEDTE